jgi:hypothetical protein
VSCLCSAEGRNLTVLEEDVVEGQNDLSVGRWPVVRVGGLHHDVPIEPQLLAVVLANVRVVPVEPRVGKADMGGETIADPHRLLGLVSTVVAVLKSQPMPVDSGLEIALVLDVDDDL